MNLIRFAYFDSLGFQYQGETSKLRASLSEHPKVSRFALDETVLHLNKSRQRCEELRKRIADLRQPAQPASTESKEDLKKRVDSKLGDERKSLRRLYSLVKKISPSIRSECLMRVEEICARNSTLVFDQEALERLAPFADEEAVKLIRDYVHYSFSVCWISTMWKYIRFPTQYMILLSKNIQDFTQEGRLSILYEMVYFVGPYIFRVAKNMTKPEIKEYLNKIYNVRVTRVNTSNMLGN